jgi:hypothetical protein
MNFVYGNGGTCGRPSRDYSNKKPINVRRGEGGEGWTGGPLGSPALGRLEMLARRWLGSYPTLGRP